jgi:hypothetical protein
VFLLALLLSGPAIPQDEVAPQSKRTGPDLGEFWPANVPHKKWKLISRADDGVLHPATLMSVENETVGPGEFILWFSHKQGQGPGDRAGERYRLCRRPDRTWLYFDTYIKSVPGEPQIEHNVQSDRILFTPSGTPTMDLIADGLHQACGATGQPYLVWSSKPRQYRIQVWGHLKESKHFKWYWDALVSGPESVIDDCREPIEQRLAIRVREAWWDNFRKPSGGWALGSGGLYPHEILPSGNGVNYGRTVWHGAGQLPYWMLGGGTATTHPTWCVDEISNSQ